MSKCPKCEKILGHVGNQHIDVGSGRDKWHGIAYTCPYCFAIIGVSIDPIAIKTDILNGVAELLKKVLRK